MDVINHTPFEVDMSIGLGPEGVVCLTTIVKATFTLPKRLGEDAAPAEQQWPIHTGDVHFEEDATASVQFEADTSSFKPCADIVLVGHAYAPGGRPVTSMDVLLRVGTLRKVLRIFGDRQWLFPSRMVLKPMMSDPEPFTKMPIRYERAFGGFDEAAADFCEHNHIGRGYIGKKRKESVHRRFLPNVEDPQRLIRSWDDAPMPAGFGFVGRSWTPRAHLAGSEEGWKDPHPEFGLPADFDHAFNNGAPPDLQIDGYLKGDEEVELINLTLDGSRRFRLPDIALEVVLHERPDGSSDDGEPQEHRLDPVLDTLVLVPDEERFYLVWRASHPFASLEDGLGATERILVRRLE